MNLRETERCFQAMAFKNCPRPLHHSPGDVHIKKIRKKLIKINRPQAAVFNPLLLTLDIFSQWTLHRWSAFKLKSSSSIFADSISGRTQSLESQMKASACSCSLFLCFCYHAASLHAKDTDNIYHGCTPTGGSYLRGCCGSHCEIYNKEREKKI